MKSYRGFSLIEVIVAIFIVSVLLVLFQALLQNTAAARASKSQGIALSIAQDEIERVRAGGYAAVPASGSFSNSLLAALPASVAAIATSDYNAKIKSVVVTVSWQEPGRSASSTVSLSTLIAKAGGLP